MRSLFLAFFTIISTLLFAQERPRVGLALSGGGAKSMAQLGALRAIEKSGIKIDYISGTSMGAVIGAMYAMGYTVDEIEYYLSLVNWDELMSNDIPRNRLPYLNKNDERYLLSINILDGKFKLPKAFNYGHYMLKVLSYLTMRNHEVTDFSKLPIPFLCMATDLETGESVAFDKGNLTDALRASVAFPSIFSPHEINGRLYVDGGVRNNLPIAILKDQKGMDFVIAIDVQGKLYDKENLNSITEVLEQVGSFQNALYFEEQKPKADILIQPQIDEFGITDYEYADTIVARGYHATTPFLQAMQRVAQKQGNLATERQCCIATPLQTFEVDTVIVQGVSANRARLAKDKLKLKKKGMYKLQTLDRGLDLLYGSNVYEKAEFQYKTIDQKDAVYLELKEKPTRHSLRFGVHYDDDFSIALLTNYTMVNAGLSNSIFSVDLAISENPRGSISWIFERGFVPTIGIRGSFNKFQPRIYNNGEPKGDFDFFTYNVDLFLQSTIGNNYTIGTGVKWDNVILSQTIPIEGFEDQENSYLNYHAYLDFDSFNRSFKPSEGFKLKGKLNIITSLEENVAKSAYSVIGVCYLQAIKFTSKFGINAGLDGAATIGSNTEYPYQIFVGGLGQNYINFTFPFLGYRFMELFGDNYFTSLKADIYYEFVKNHFLSVKGNIGKLEPTVDELFNSEILLDGYGAAYAYNSPIGPLELTVMGSTNHSNIYTYISLGFWF